MYSLNNFKEKSTRNKFAVITQEIVNQNINYPLYEKDTIQRKQNLSESTNQNLYTNNRNLTLKSKSLSLINRPLPIPNIMINKETQNENTIALPQFYSQNYKTNPNFLCGTCYKNLGSGKIISVSGKKYHLDCFFCVHCMTNLEHVAFYEHEHKLYCHLDYHELFSPKCKSCGTSIEDKAIFALGNYYHPFHFFCAGCGDPFDENISFIEKDKYAWCQRCFEKKYCPKCEKCQKSIVNDLVHAMDSNWHTKCFTCSICNSELTENFYIYNETLNCPSCYSLIIKQYN
ncbi:hypothetical protein PCK1_001286 [Pneumocystis canis]|nr:hypothetical protein PCK1_001286 [Pneumocystis canis]